jgi:hypothetical protein
MSSSYNLFVRKPEGPRDALSRGTYERLARLKKLPVNIKTKYSKCKMNYVS